MLPLAAQASKTKGSCWERLETTPLTQAPTKQFIHLAKIAEELFEAPLFTYKTHASKTKTRASQKPILFEWLNDIEAFGPYSEHTYETLAAAIATLPLTQGVFFSKSPAFFSQVILERDLKEGDTVTVPDASGFSASKMTVASPIPFFASDDRGKGAAHDLFRSGPCIFVFGEANDFESIYPLREHREERLHENEVNFGPGTKFKVLKVIYQSDQGAGTFFLKQI